MTKCVGKSVARLDGVAKVTGQALYLDDLQLPDCWYAGVVRSTIPYGKIKNIAFDAAFDWSKVVTCDWRDIPGKNATIFIKEDQPILAQELVRHVGEAIVLVAAPTKALAKQAVRNVKIDYEELTPVLSIEASKKQDPLIWGENNIQSQYCIVKGSVEKGFADADVVVEGEYRTGFHEHLYIEPQAVAAIPRPDGGLTVTGSLQCPYYVLKTLKAVLGVDETRINVAQNTMGGAFGGKEDYPSLTGSYVALLAKKSGKPVKLVYGREEDIEVSTKRHPSVIKHKTGVKKDGTLMAMEIQVDFDGGAYSTMSPVVLSRGVIHSAGPYKCPHLLARAACFATNKVPSGAYRGFGVPQVTHALEIHMDKVAEALGMTPQALRTKNCLHVGDSTGTSQVLKESVAAEECLNEVLAATGFKKKHALYKKSQKTKARVKKGIGLSLFMHGGAFTGSGEAIMKTEAGLLLNQDGTVSVLTGCTDMGQGAHTVLPQIAADALGLPVSLVRTEMPNTALVPDSGPTVASRTTMIIGSVMEKCAAIFKAALFDFVAEQRCCDPARLRFADAWICKGTRKVVSFQKAAEAYLKTKGVLKVLERYQLPPGIVWDAQKHVGDAYPAYSWQADVAEVLVDSDTFEVTVEKMTMVVEMGKAVNPLLAEGNIEGGTLQALGWGLMEDSAYKNGRPVNNRLQTYIIPTVKDTPEWNTIILEKPFSAGPQGAKGIGELPLDGGAPAIVNAIHNATGIWINELPVTPEKIWGEGTTHGNKTKNIG